MPSAYSGSRLRSTKSREYVRRSLQYRVNEANPSTRIPPTSPSTSVRTTSRRVVNTPSRATGVRYTPSNESSMATVVVTYSTGPSFHSVSHMPSAPTDHVSPPKSCARPRLALSCSFGFHSNSRPDRSGGLPPPKYRREARPFSRVDLPMGVAYWTEVVSR